MLKHVQHQKRLIDLSAASLNYDCRMSFTLITKMCKANILKYLSVWIPKLTSELKADIWNTIYSTNGPRQANLLLIAYASSEGSGEPAHPRSLARTFAARSYKQWVKRNLQTESQIPGPSEWLGMRSWNLSWPNAWRHKFAWRGSFIPQIEVLSSTLMFPYFQRLLRNSLKPSIYESFQKL